MSKFYSNHHKSQKISAIIGLMNRAISLTSPSFRNETIQKVEDILMNNNYLLQHKHKIK